jgi:hypothetical protein
LFRLFESRLLSTLSARADVHTVAESACQSLTR